MGYLQDSSGPDMVLLKNPLRCFPHTLCHSRKNKGFSVQMDHIQMQIIITVFLVCICVSRMICRKRYQNLLLCQFPVGYISQFMAN